VASFNAKLEVVRRILEDPLIRKGMQHGSHDVKKIRDVLDIQVRGYDHDTEYSEYLRFSNRRAFGLEATADVRFREFAGYKGILDPYRDAKGRASFLKVPPEIIIKYNGADCDLTKRIERDNKDKVDQELLQVYMRAAFPLALMEESGPWFDVDHDELLKTWIPVRLKQLLGQLRKISGEKSLNPRSTKQVAAVVYDKLKLGRYLEEEWKKDHKRSTDKETMQLLANFHAFPSLQQEFRKLDKKKGTYMDGYRKSAELHEGRLRTNWWLTGTVTGRLRSGGEKGKAGDAKLRGIINLQNIHGDPAIECLLVSDVRWRELYKAWKETQK
jgi:DNA polymerase I-like protein with 3'-5' exonuclease and polymerase domains